MFLITVSTGLLTKEHHDRMGNAVWLFMWFLDRTTKIDSDSMGWVLGGKPITYDEISFLKRRTAKRYMATLKKEKYIVVTRTMRGMIIKVCKCKKKFGWKVERSATSGPSDGPFMAHQGTKSGPSNKTVQYDSTELPLTPVGVEVGLKTKKEPMNPELTYEEVDDTGRPVKKIPGIKKPISQRRAVFDQELEIKDLLNSPVLFHKIVGVYIRRKKYRFRNYDQWYPAIAREIKASKPLKGYSHDEIIRAMKYCEEKWPDTWTLETCAKRIYEVVKNDPVV